MKKTTELYEYIQEWKPYAGQEFDPATSQVVPDDSLSLMEILERHTRGESLEVGKNVFYDQDEQNTIDWEKFQGLDLVEQQEMFQQWRDEWEMLKGKLQTQPENTPQRKKSTAESEASAAADQKP